MRKRNERRRNAKRRRSGLTLMEIMLVLVILVVLASASGLALLAFRRRAMNNAAMDGIRTTEMAVEAYLLDKGRLPENLDILYAPVDKNDRYLDSEPLDPWTTPYNYEPGTGEDFLISSNGPDQAQGGDDDIFSPKDRQNANR